MNATGREAATVARIGIVACWLKAIQPVGVPWVVQQSICHYFRLNAELCEYRLVAKHKARDWRNDIEGFGGILASHLPHYSNLIQSRESALGEG